MHSVGESLRAARVELGLTLEQISASTRISVKNLRAIEADELATINSAFFYKSFTRQFAQEVGLDCALLSAAVQAAASTIPEPEIPGRGSAPPLRISRMRGKRGGGVRWFFSVASFASMLVVCSTLYAMWQNSRAEIEASISSLVKSFTSSSAPEHASKKAIPDNPSSQAPSSAQLHSQPVPPPAAAPASFELKLSALEETWLSIAADGKQVFSGILQQSESKVLEGYESARIRTGNAGGLDVEFNGRSIGTLGPRGQVRTVLFNKDTYEIVSPAAHIALIQFSP